MLIQKNLEPYRTRAPFFRSRCSRAKFSFSFSNYIRLLPRHNLLDLIEERDFHFTFEELELSILMNINGTERNKTEHVFMVKWEDICIKL